MIHLLYEIIRQQRFLKIFILNVVKFYCNLTLIYVAVGLYDTQSFEWPFLLPTKVPMYKKVKQFVFLVQSIVL